MSESQVLRRADVRQQWAPVIHPRSVAARHDPRQGLNPSGPKEQEADEAAIHMNVRIQESPGETSDIKKQDS